LTIDPARHEVQVDGRTVRMGLAEFKLLTFLVGHPERVFSRSQLLDNVWGDHVFIEERTVDVHVLASAQGADASWLARPGPDRARPGVSTLSGNDG
jgi:hypothetical protein